jgi:hypothetical protein
VRGLRGGGRGGGVRSGPGTARTILLFLTISARPSKQPRMVGSTLGVYSFGLIFVSARTNKRHHHHQCLFLLDYLACVRAEGVPAGFQLLHVALLSLHELLSITVTWREKSALTRNQHITRGIVCMLASS